MIQIAFYKDDYKWWSRLIKWWTNSSYSHCEFYIDGALYGISTEQSVRKLSQPLNLKKWDTISIYDEELKQYVLEFFEETKGSRYDWKGIILTQIFNMRRSNKNKYTCSEWVISVLDKKYNVVYPKNYIQITPQDIFNLVTDKKLSSN